MVKKRSKFLAESEVFKKKLIEINDNLHLNVEDYNDIFDICKAIYDNQFKDALQNSKWDKVAKILDLATTFSDLRIESMKDNFNKIQNITQEKLQNLKEFILGNANDVKININNQIKST